MSKTKSIDEIIAEDSVDMFKTEDLPKCYTREEQALFAELIGLKTLSDNIREVILEDMYR